LGSSVNPGVVLLHDRAIPGRRSNIDHLAIAQLGVWVIDAKRYAGKVEVRKPLFGRRELRIAGRDQTKLVDGLAGQVEMVQEIIPGTPVRGALCFVDADLPLVGTLEIDGFVLAYPRRLAKRINRPGPLDDAQVRSVADLLTARLPAR